MEPHVRGMMMEKTVHGVRIAQVGDHVTYAPNLSAGVGIVRERWLDGETYNVDFPAKGLTSVPVKGRDLIVQGR